MKKSIVFILLIFIVIITVLLLTNINDKDENKSEDFKEGEYKMNIIINEKEYEVELYENETSKALLELLPLDLSMKELNGNEKYYYLNKSLPTNSKNPGMIEKGDIMLYGNDCLVIFYKSFNTSYSYTKIGHIDNLPDLGDEDINIKFIKQI